MRKSIRFILVFLYLAYHRLSYRSHYFLLLGPLHPSLGTEQQLIAVLDCWRFQGRRAALAYSNQFTTTICPKLNPLFNELILRLSGAKAPRILLDGLWFTRTHGGITRVWEQIMRCWSLPELITPKAPIAIIDRNSHLAITGLFENISGSHLDPLDLTALSLLPDENYHHAREWNASIFISSWISVCSNHGINFPELALVHDCLPERSTTDPFLMQQRCRWLKGASGHLAVSSATASDLELFLKKNSQSVAWCHPGIDPVFSETLSDSAHDRLWPSLQARSGLCDPYVVLPATSKPGSYKNPELVASALLFPGLQNVQLVLSGIAAAEHRLSLLEKFPSLAPRCMAAGFTDLELALAYRHALAVVLPSRIEGFGLPAIEALASEATVLIADSRGLREAGGIACPRFSADSPDSLSSWLLMLLDCGSMSWLKPKLQLRAYKRLKQLHPDLLGLALLALSRRIARIYN
jgi:glycosyltransferase involved in cell wall biosynthesis